ncbi:hypothetical protein PtB15_3B194 [Puccinia triticina]|nr:hypothetical protein PtB15_3B194 [Puccinia triticina]
MLTIRTRIRSTYSTYQHSRALSSSTHFYNQSTSQITRPDPREETVVQKNDGLPKAKSITWSANQKPKSQAMIGPRFEQTNLDAQPNPLPAIELIKKQPIRMVPSRVAACDGGGGALGHPRVFINLDKPGPQPCGGLRFERSHDDHH